MPQFRATFIFNQNRYGWTESWHREDSNPDNMLEQAKKLATKRRMLASSEVKLEYIRISDVAVVGDSLVHAYDQWGSGPLPDADTPWNAIYCRVESGSKYRRQMYLRGVPDDWIKLTAGNPNANPIDSALDTAFKAFRSQLLAGGWQLKTVSKEPGDAVEKNIGAITQDTEGRIAFQITGLSSATGDEFRVKSYQGPDKKVLNGVYKVVSNNGTIVVVPKKYNLLTDPVSNSGGKAVPRVVRYQLITEAKIMRCAKKSTGRAFFVEAGRRKVRR